MVNQSTTRTGTPNDGISVEFIDSESESEMSVATGGRLRPRPASRPISSHLNSYQLYNNATQTNGLAKGPLKRSNDDNPASVLDEDALSRIRRAYNLPSSMALRLPRGGQRADDAGWDEIVIYEDFIAFGLRERVPSLVAKVAKYLDVSPGQFSPSMWRTLMAFQVFGELFSVDMGLNEILHAYSLRNCPNEESRYMMHPRKRPPLISDTVVLERDWKTRNLFIKVGCSTEFPITWMPRFVRTKRCKAGESGFNKAMEMEKSSGRRSLSFLTSEIALRCSTIWGFNTMNGQPRSGDEIYARFVEARKIKLAEAVNVPLLLNGATSTAETLCEKEPDSSKRMVCEDAAAPAASKRLKAASDGNSAIPPSSRSEITTHLNIALSLQDFEHLNTLGVSAVFDELHANFLKDLSMFNYLKENMSSTMDQIKSMQGSVDALTQQLSIVSRNASEMESMVASKDKDITGLEKVVHDHELVISGLKARSLALEEKNTSLMKEHAALECKNASLRTDIDFAVGAATITTRWRLMEEWDAGKTEHWNVADAREQYQFLKQTEATIQGLPPRSSGTPIETGTASECAASRVDTVEPVVASPK